MKKILSIILCCLLLTYAPFGQAGEIIYQYNNEPEKTIICNTNEILSNVKKLVNDGNLTVLKIYSFTFHQHQLEELLVGLSHIKLEKVYFCYNNRYANHIASPATNNSIIKYGHEKIQLLDARPLLTPDFIDFIKNIHVEELILDIPGENWSPYEEQRLILLELLKNHPFLKKVELSYDVVIPLLRVIIDLGILTHSKSITDIKLDFRLKSPQDKFIKSYENLPQFNEKNSKLKKLSFSGFSFESDNELKSVLNHIPIALRKNLFIELGGLSGYHIESLSWLLDQGFQFISLSDRVSYWERGGTPCPSANIILQQLEKKRQIASDAILVNGDRIKDRFFILRMFCWPSFNPYIQDDDDLKQLEEENRTHNDTRIKNLIIKRNVQIKEVAIMIRNGLVARGFNIYGIINDPSLMEYFIKEFLSGENNSYAEVPLNNNFKKFVLNGLYVGCTDYNDFGKQRANFCRMLRKWWQGGNNNNIDLTEKETKKIIDSMKQIGKYHLGALKVAIDNQDVYDDRLKIKNAIKNEIKSIAEVCRKEVIEVIPISYCDSICEKFLGFILGEAFFEYLQGEPEFEDEIEQETPSSADIESSLISASANTTNTQETKLATSTRSDPQPSSISDSRTFSTINKLDSSSANNIYSSKDSFSNISTSPVNSNPNDDIKTTASMHDALISTSSTALSSSAAYGSTNSNHEPQSVTTTTTSHTPNNGTGSVAVSSPSSSSGTNSQGTTTYGGGFLSSIPCTVMSSSSTGPENNNHQGTNNNAHVFGTITVKDSSPEAISQDEEDYLAQLMASLYDPESYRYSLKIAKKISEYISYLSSPTRKKDLEFVNIPKEPLRVRQTDPENGNEVKVSSLDKRLKTKMIKQICESTDRSTLTLLRTQVWN